MAFSSTEHSFRRAMAKRMHEYKRQLLNVMNIISLYNELKDDPNKKMQPQTFIFGAKAAPSYLMAKKIIKLICYLAEDIRKQPKIREKLNVVYMEDYNVSMAERLMPAQGTERTDLACGKRSERYGQHEIYDQRRFDRGHARRRER